MNEEFENKEEGGDNDEKEKIRTKNWESVRRERKEKEKY